MPARSSASNYLMRRAGTLTAERAPIGDSVNWYPRYANCLFAALYWRVRYGGRLKFLKAKRWFGFHVQWCDVGGTLWEYVHPDSDKPDHYLPWYRLPRLFIYRGIVRRVP